MLHYGNLNFVLMDHNFKKKLNDYSKRSNSDYIEKIFTFKIKIVQVDYSLPNQVNFGLVLLLFCHFYLAFVSDRNA